MNPPVFAVLGSGMQGTAAAYDLVRFAHPAQVRMGDLVLDQAHHAAGRVNRLTHSDLCSAHQVDATDPGSLASFFDEVSVVLSCLPYWMHPRVAEAAIAAGASMVDLGGNTEITWQTLALDAKAKAAGVSLVPDTGLAPGLVNSIAAAIIETLDETESVKLYCGVLPQNPVPPFNYKLTFNVEGLVAEYDYQAIVLRGGHIAKVDTLTEVEWVHSDELGRLEAFTTSGGTSTAPYTFEGRLQSYEYKTLRYPGHCALMRLFKDYGFWGEEVVEVRGANVRPKDVFCAVFGPKLAEIEDRDVCMVRGVGEGCKDGKPTTVQVDILDRECEATGFTAMERLTGFSCSIVAQACAAGEVAKGAVRYEQAVPGRTFLARLKQRGIALHVSSTVRDALSIA